MNNLLRDAIFRKPVVILTRLKFESLPTNCKLYTGQPLDAVTYHTVKVENDNAGENEYVKEKLYEPTTTDSKPSGSANRGDGNSSEYDNNADKEESSDDDGDSGDPELSEEKEADTESSEEEYKPKPVKKRKARVQQGNRPNESKPKRTRKCTTPMQNEKRPEGPYTCQYCQKSIKGWLNWVNHEKIHRGDFRFTCPHCPKGFIDRHCLEEHILTHTGEKPFQCRFCEAKFRFKSNVRMHEKRHMGTVKKVSCSLCDRKYDNITMLKIHQRSHTGEKPFKCDDCGKAFATKSSLCSHIKHLHSTENERKPCPICNKLIKERSLRDHLKIHVGEKKFQCRFCDKKYLNNKSRMQHERMHTRERPYPCRFCPMMFRQRGHAISHERRLHTFEKPYECSECHMKFAGADMLQRHFRLHTGEKPYKCSECGKAYRLQQSLKGHMFFHTGIYKYHCPYCPYASNMMTSMRKHTLVKHENGPKNYRCHYCQKSFYTNSDLNHHVKIHASFKKYECQFCGKAFTTKDYCKIHERYVHLKVRPPPSRLKQLVRKEDYLCHICNKQFHTKDAFASHKAKHLGKKDYKCELCGKAFYGPTSLVRHKQSHLERRFRCKACRHIFTTKSSLRAHVHHVHMGWKKSFWCHFCPQKFDDFTSRNKHENSSHKEQYECDDCGKVFCRERLFRQHTLEHVIVPSETAWEKGRLQYTSSQGNETEENTLADCQETHQRAVHKMETEDWGEDEQKFAGQKLDPDEHEEKAGVKWFENGTKMEESIH